MGMAISHALRPAGGGFVGESLMFTDVPVLPEWPVRQSEYRVALAATPVF
jgi:hypothetical protein